MFIFLKCTTTVSVRIVAVYCAILYRDTQKIKRATTFEFTTEPAIIFIHC